jgi:DNA-binding transcriptional MocR family regulator
LVDLKIATTFGGGRLASDLVLHVLRDGSYRKQMEGLRDRLSRAMTTVSAQLADVGIVPWLEPEAGMFLWCRLPDGLDAVEIAREALAANIVLAPGNVFSLSRSAHGYLRFNVAQSLDDRLFDVLRTIIRRREGAALPRRPPHSSPRSPSSPRSSYSEMTATFSAEAEPGSNS